MKLNKRVLTALLYILIAIVPIIALFTFSLSSYLKAVKEDNAAAIMQTLKQAAIYVTNEMEAARSLSDAMLVNKDINSALMDDPSTQTMDEQIEELTKLMNVMTTIKQSAYSFRIRLYVQDSKFYSNQRINFFPMSDFSSVPLEGAATPGGSYSAPYEMKYIDQDYPKIVVSHARILRNIHRFGEFIGATVIDLNVAEYLGLLQEMDFPEKYAVYFVDANGTKIISLNSMELGEISPIDLKRANAAGET
ncbi:MAG: cache domain-containing protein, partial [Clostridiales bacterium]|nr:cache domain-containing protein [Clostridiales bacterium]